MAQMIPAIPIQPLAIDDLLQKRLKNFVYRVGIELEGGWLKLPEGVDLARDGSIIGIELTPAELLASKNQKMNGEAYLYLKIGELASEPMELTKLTPWIQQSYPSHVNETCGLHVHYSFKDARHYQWLMVPEYQATMQHYLGLWAKEEGLPADHPIWKRLRGENEFCKAEFFADLQASKKRKNYGHEPGGRYTIINYPHGLHGTMECRVLPMFDNAGISIRAVQRVLDVTNASILRCAIREESVRGVVEVDPNDRVVEEVEEFV